MVRTLVYRPTASVSRSKNYRACSDCEVTCALGFELDPSPAYARPQAAFLCGDIYLPRLRYAVARD